MSYGLSISPSLDKFNLPMPEQNHYDVIRDKTIFAPSSTNTAEFEVKNRGKSITVHLLFVTFVYFSK